MQRTETHNGWKYFLWLAMVAVFNQGPAIAADSLALLPADITLNGPHARQRLVVERVQNGAYVGQVTENVQIESGNPNVVTVDDGFAVPVGNGKTNLTISVGKESVNADVVVGGMDQSAQWSFRNHVQAVLAKAGCNSGACHGAEAGKKGLKLSLRGYDAFGDYLTLTHQARGRRISLRDPGRSLILMKPTMTVTHGGGLRFEPESLEYQVLADWIASGAPAPKDDDPRIERIEILPSASILDLKTVQQMLVRAHFSDGRTEDVTRWAKYASTNAEVANVDESGNVKIVGNGEGAVTAWYLNKIVVATITVPYRQTLAEEAFTKAAKRNFIDELVLEKLRELNVPPSPLCSDSEFIRRAFLDTLGVLPTARETQTFVDDASPDKRDALIESLLSRSEFVDYWTYKWSDLLLVNSEKLPAQAMWSYYNWIRHHVAANTRWDEFTRQLLTAQGSTLENGAANFFVLHQDPRALTETVSLAFMGLSIGCAKCHNHPLEKWTNDQYFAMANLLSRVRLKDGKGAGNLTVFAATEGELIQPLRGEAQPPTPLDGQPVSFDSREDRRVHLVDWLVAPENPYFAKAIANRIWANFMGVGVVANVDDLRATNPPSNPKLLDALRQHLVEKQFDVKALMRTILQSATYQRASQPLPENSGDARFYSRYYPRRLMAEVMIDAISAVTGVPSKFPGYPAEWRALQLPDSNVASYFLDKFGRHNRQITCDCERTNAPDMVQVLHLSNGDVINEKLRAKNNRIDSLLAEKASDEEIVEELYRAAFSRSPTSEEKHALIDALKEADQKDRRLVIEDLFWSVLTSKEFLFNH